MWWEVVDGWVVPRQHSTASEWGEATTNLRAYLGQFASELGVSKGDVLITGVETRGRAEDPARSLGALMRVRRKSWKPHRATAEFSSSRNWMQEPWSG
ncbi:hypothetical protein DIPPA_24011 [Diplonema papillatum]|nr:hypothetical protein DIPPA_24011 [Diplonema papillatum]